MKIGFYIHYSSLKAGGIFTYSVAILKLLLNADQIEKIYLIIGKNQLQYFKSLSENPKIQINIIDRSNIIIQLRMTLSYSLMNLYTYFNSIEAINKSFLLIKKLAFFVNPYKKVLNPSIIDLFHVPIQYSPIYGSKVPIIVTMHDLQEYHFPQFFNAKEKKHRTINNKKTAIEANHIVVSFNHIKNDLMRFLNIEQQKISVCPPPFSEDWFSSFDFTSEKDLTTKYNLSSEFILYPAATWEHKNHINLIKAIAKLKDEGIIVKLICTGHKTDYYKVLDDEIEKLKIKSLVKFLGIIPEKDLIGLYKTTSLVVIPTLYEAGSAPLYESMKYSVPVICSNVTSLPEAMGDDEFVFDPTNINDIVLKIKLILTNNEFRTRNLINSKERIDLFKSADYKNAFIEVYQKVLKNCP